MYIILFAALAALLFGKLNIFTNLILAIIYRFIGHLPMASAARWFLWLLTLSKPRLDFSRNN